MKNALIEYAPEYLVTMIGVMKRLAAGAPESAGADRAALDDFAHQIEVDLRRSQRWTNVLVPVEAEQAERLAELCLSAAYAFSDRAKREQMHDLAHALANAPRAAKVAELAEEMGPPSPLAKSAPAAPAPATRAVSDAIAFAVDAVAHARKALDHDSDGALRLVAAANGALDAALKAGSLLHQP